MVLAVAGLTQNAITMRTDRLASGDWSSFPPAERLAFFFARKHADNPRSITAQDMQRLANFWGTERAVDIVWWTARCQYMTRVADAFQLPLESVNVFDGFAAVPRQEAKEDLPMGSGR